MTGQDIVTGLRAEVVEPNPAFFTTPVLLYWINRAQSIYVRRTKVLQSFSYLSTKIGQKKYPMPSNWLASEKIFWNNPVNGVDSWTPLKPTCLEKMAQESPNWLSSDANMRGTVQKYFIEQRDLYIFPANRVNGNNDLFMFFEAKPITLTTLNDPISIDDSLVDGIEQYVLSKMWKMDEEPEKATEAMNEFIQAVGEGLKWKKRRVLDGKWKVDIESYCPFTYGSSAAGAANSQANPLNI